MQHGLPNSRQQAPLAKGAPRLGQKIDGEHLKDEQLTSAGIQRQKVFAISFGAQGITVMIGVAAGVLKRVPPAEQAKDIEEYFIEDFVSDINRARVLRVRSVMQDLTADKFAGDVDANDNLESLITASGGDTALRYRVLENGKPVGELDMRELVKALVPRISSSEAGTRYH